MTDDSLFARISKFLFSSAWRIFAVCAFIIALALGLYAFSIAGTRVEPDVSVERALATPTTEEAPQATKKPTIGSTMVAVHPNGVFSEHTAKPTPFPIDKPRTGRAESIPAWWEKPAPLTDSEMGFVRYLSAVTWYLPQAKRDKIWTVGRDQRGLHTIRFYAGFVGYAAMALGMRTPAYPGLTAKMALGAIERVLHRNAWSFVELLWSDQPWFPDPVIHENIQYSGHVLQLMVMYEMLTGDERFRTEGFDFVWDEEKRFHYTVDSLAKVIVGQMKGNPCGGVACEPRHVFFVCNTHPHVALKMLEGMGRGDFSDVRTHWENFVLSSFYDDLGAGAIRGVYNQDKKRFFPIGYPGADGWGLTWYYPWATDPEVPRAIWKIARSRIKPDIFSPVQRLKKEKPKLRGTKDLAAYLTAVMRGAFPPIPTATHLYAAAATFGDAKWTTELRSMLEKRFLRQKGGTYYLKVPHKFNLGSNANMALGLALENGSNMRYLTQRPLPRDYFEGPLVEDVRPPTAAVYQAYRDGSVLVVEIESPGPVDLVLKNVEKIKRLKGLNAGSWTYEGRVLHIETGGRHVLRIKS